MIWNTEISENKIHVLLIFHNFLLFSSVQSFSRVQLFVTIRTIALQASLSIRNSQSLLKFMSIESVSSTAPFSICLQSFPASRSLQMSQLFESGGQSIRASALTSVLPMNIQDWFPLELIGLISLQSKGLSRVFSSTTVGKHQFFFMVQLSHLYWKNYSFDYMDLCWENDISAF